MIVLGIDPGPTHCGAVLYDTEARRVIGSWKDLTVDAAIGAVESLKDTHRVELVAIERVSA